MPSLANLTKLEELYLNENEFTTLPSTIGSMTSLKKISLYGNNFSGELPASLADLDSLERFHIGWNYFEGEIPAGLMANSSLIRDVRVNNNTTLEGPLPLAFGNATMDLEVSFCSFTFSDILPVSENYNGTGLYYENQQKVDSVHYISGYEGKEFLLIAGVDTQTDPDSKFQWFKREGQTETPMIPSPTVAGDTLTFNSLADTDEGTYFYKIWNDSLPDLVLTSHDYHLNVIEGQEIRYCLEYQLDTENNPGLAKFSYEPNFDSLAAECIAKQQAENDTLIKMATELLLEEWATDFYSSYRTHCLDSLEESLSYTYVPKEYHYTLYYYDQAGNLVQTVPPKGVRPLSETQVEEVKLGTALYPSHEMETRYQYNSRNQLIRQESPDAGKSRFWYNKAGQLRLSQDAKQFEEGAYSYTKYDRQGRVIEVGEMLTEINPDSLQYYVNYIRFPDPEQYTRRDITVTHYDYPVSGADSTFVQENLRSRVSWTEMIEEGAQDTVYTIYSYDPHGNVKSLLQKLPDIGYKRTDYVYDLISGNVNFVFYQYGEEDQLMHRYTYDADNRIREVQTSTDGFIWNSDARYIYYPHSLSRHSGRPLARVELGEYNVQGLDYYYTLQGWLKGVNMPMAGDPGTDGENGLRTGTDAFAFTLGYHEGDYTPVNPNVTLSDGRDQLWERYKDQGDSTLTGLFNGNISWMNTDLSGLDANQRMQAMVYGYDQLHRIVQARSLTDYSQGSGYATRSQSPEAYDVDYSYDPNGNLLTLQRRDQYSAVQEDYEYGYYYGTNRLWHTAQEDGDNYQYDPIGNLISDAKEGTSIKWNPYGKVREVLKQDSSGVSFRYDAAGNRIAKITDSDSTIYVRDASGNVMAVYKNDTLIEQSIYGSNRLGLHLQDAKPGYRTLGHKTYELSNHLGNVLATVRDRIQLSSDSTWAETVSISDYYPFGLTMSGRSLSDSTYRYGFNGKEQDSPGMGGGGNTYDYGFRIYNPGIGKFLSVDPLASNYPYFTPYQFAGNMPIWAADLDGLEPYIPGIYKPELNPDLTQPAVRKQRAKDIGKVVATGAVIIGGIYATPWVAESLLTSARPYIAPVTLAAGKYGPDAVAFAAGALGYDGEIPGASGDELGKLVNKGLKAGAAKFYSKFAGYAGNLERIASHLDGIDFEKNVYEKTLEAGTVVEQWVGKRGVGDYFTKPGADPKKLGISLKDRVKKLFTLTEDVKVLQSTTSDIAGHKGGELQYFSPEIKEVTKEINQQQ